MPRVSPEVLRWAREAAGLSVADAARKVLNDTKAATAEERLNALEQGEGELTGAQLSRLADVYHRPLITFYMPAPPKPVVAVEDFRTLPERGDPTSNGLVSALLRDVTARQALVRGLLEDEEAPSVPFVGQMTMRDGVKAVAETLGRAVGWDQEEFRLAPSPERAFELLRSKVEAAGVFVLLLGDLGSHHTAIDAEVFRGFALADPIAPFVVINDQDARVAWSFTLFHELAHICLGQTGVSGGRFEGVIERFCNEVASLLLLGTDELETIEAVDQDARELMAAIDVFARQRRVSRQLVTYRLYLAGKLSIGEWEAVRDMFQAEYQRDRDAQRARQRAQAGGPNYYIVRRHRLGSALLSLIERNLHDGSITPSKAALVLGVKARNVGALVSGRAA